MIDPGLAGKVVLVTGTNSPLGIGAAIAAAFVEQDAAVFLTYLRQPPEMYGISEAAATAATSPGEELYRARNADPPDAVLRYLSASGARVAAAEFDLADAKVGSQLFDAAENAFGPVEVLVNNAAYSQSDTFDPTAGTGPDWAGRSLAVVDPESHFRHFSVNSRAVASLMSEFAQRHVERGATWGRIVNVSTDGADSFPGEVSYGASKAALESYSRSAAIELARYGITVNIVAPGPIQTG
jgi:3-oxoacyl-[acyl-carrier protein] reductase